MKTSKDRLMNRVWCLRAQPCSTLLQGHGLQPANLLCPWNFLDKNTGEGCHFLLQMYALLETTHKRERSKFI